MAGVEFMPNDFGQENASLLRRHTSKDPATSEVSSPFTPSTTNSDNFVVKPELPEP